MGFYGPSTAQPLDSDLTTVAGLTATTDNFIQSKASAWASRTIAQVLTDTERERLYQAGAGISATYNHAIMGANQTALTSARPYGFGIGLFKGEVVTNISFLSGTTAAATAANIWFALTNATGGLLGITADDAASAWPSNTLKTLALTSAVTIATSGIYYLVYMVKAGTMPSFVGAPGRDAGTAMTPWQGFVDNTNTALTNPASCPNPVILSAQSPNKMFGYVT